MKKKLKRLKLHRETLVHLNQRDLREVAGGATRFCQFSGQATCNTCAATCTTNLC